LSKELAIRVCLLRLKRAIENDHCVFVERQKNTQALFDLGLTLDSLFDVLLRLTPADYAGGPEADDNDTEGQIWKFTHPVEGQTVYIKLKFFSIQDQDWMKILSFHPTREEL